MTQTSYLLDAFSAQSAKLLMRLFLILLIGGVVFDFGSTWLHFHEISFWRVSLIFRAIIGFIISFLVLIYFHRWPNYVQWLVGSCVVSMLVLWAGYAITPIADWKDYLESTIELYKMIYPALLFVGLRLIFWRHPFLAGKLFTALDIALVAYLLFIFIGFFSGSDMFRTYWRGVRPGYRGIIMSQNEATGTMLVAIFWFGMRYFSGQRHVLFFIVSVVATLILGTKGALLAIVPLLFGMFWARYGAIKMVPILGWMLVGMAVLSVTAYQFSEAIRGDVALFWNYMSSHLYGDSFRAMVTLLMSGRDLRVEAFLPTLSNDLSAINLIGGMPIAYGSMEIDPIDAFLRGGLLFLVLLLISYWKIFFYSGGRNGKSYKLILFVLWMGIAFTGGHLWMASTTAPMLILSLAYASTMSAYTKYPVHRQAADARYVLNI